MFAIDITEREHLDAPNLEGGLDIDHAIPTTADQAEFELLGFGNCFCRVSDEGAEREAAGGGGADELTTIDLFHNARYSVLTAGSGG